MQLQEDAMYDALNDERDISRDMRRLASLYNGVAMEQLLAMYWNVLIDDRLNEDGKLRLDVQACNKPVAERALFGDRVSDSRKKTVVSVNKCVAVIDYNTPWLALCIEGNTPILILVEVGFTDANRSGLWHQGGDVRLPKACSSS